MNKIIVLTICIQFITFFNISNISAQPLTGYTGLITTPTAEISTDGKISFGINFIDKKYNIRRPNKYHQYSYLISLGYLPFTEISLRLTHHYKYSKEQAFGDRSPSVKIRLLKENKYYPAIAIGAQDFIGECNNFNALYAVASKKYDININRYSFQTNFHLGYGTDKMEARHYQFVGIFGGLSFGFYDIISLMVEYDSEKYNVGLKLNILNHGEILLALLNMDTFSCGINCSLVLPKKKL